MQPSTVMTITPEVAARLLEQNASQGAAIQRVRELCDLTERTVLDAMPALDGEVVVYVHLVRRALDGDA